MKLLTIFLVHCLIIHAANASRSYDNSSSSNNSNSRSASASIDTSQVQFYSKIRKEADIRSFMVGLRNSTDSNSKAYCAGVLISSLYVLTSNLCGTITTNDGEAWQYASIGSIYDRYNGMGEVIRVSWRYTHPDYKSDTHDNDFMLMRLAERSKQTPVRLPAADSDLFPSGKKGTVFGWNSGDPVISDADSAYMFVTKMSWTDCSKVVSLPSQYCAIGINKTDACHTSLGSPMVVNEPKSATLVGIVSGRFGCGQTDQPTLFANVAKARSWIKKIAGT